MDFRRPGFPSTSRRLPHYTAPWSALPVRPGGLAPGMVPGEGSTEATDRKLAGIIGLGTATVNAFDAYINGNRTMDVQETVFRVGIQLRYEQLDAMLSARDANDLAAIARLRLSVERASDKRDELQAYIERLDAVARSKETSVKRWGWTGGIAAVALLIVLYWYLARRRK